MDQAILLGRGAQIFPSGNLFGPMVIVRHSTGEFLSSTVIPLDGSSRTFLRCGKDRLTYRNQGGFSYEYVPQHLYVFRLP